MLVLELLAPVRIRKKAKRYTYTICIKSRNTNLISIDSFIATYSVKDLGPQHFFDNAGVMQQSNNLL